nr:class I SAM-dependent methyltransferase [Comamonas koreensis]
MNFSEFYRAFEERCYAPRSVIKGLREQYLAYIAPLAVLYPGAGSFDIGCGRGEWLELMQAQGFNPLGVDLDAGMLQACVDLGLPAQQGDGIAHLQTLGDETQAVVTAFHVVEHIPFEQLQILVWEAQRVLKPGGLLIMETPNPENIAVATRNFYLDPTHLRPIPPMLLGFLPEFHGFSRVSTLRLQEPRDIHVRSDISLTDVLHHVSPDYAVVAQKGASPAVLAAFDGAFSESRGVDLHNLANRFDQRQNELMAAHHETHLNGLATYAALETARGDLRVLRDELQALRGEFRSVLQSLHAELATTQAARDSLLHSASWKITAPLRGIGAFAASPMSFTIDKVLKYPRLSDWMNRAISQLPWLHAHLRNKAISRGLLCEPLAASEMATDHHTLSDLSPRAKLVHMALEQEIARRRG